MNTDLREWFEGGRVWFPFSVFVGPGLRRDDYGVARIACAPPEKL